MPVKVRSSSVAEFEKKFEKKSGGDNQIIWPTRLGAKGRNSITVHFLTDVDEWAEYGQFYNSNTGYVIETEENSEEMEQLTGKRASTVHLAAALDVSTGKVIIVQLPWSLVEDIRTLRAKQWEKSKAALTDLDIELERTGTGLDTKYRAYPEGKAAIDVSRFPIPGGKESWKVYLFDLVEKMAYPQGKDEDVTDAEEDTDVEADTDTDVEEAEAEVVKPKRVLKRKVG